MTSISREGISRAVIYNTIAKTLNLPVNRGLRREFLAKLPRAVQLPDGRVNGAFLPYIAKHLIVDRPELGQADAQRLMEVLQAEGLASSISKGQLPEHLQLENVYLSMVREKEITLRGLERAAVTRAINSAFYSLSRLSFASSKTGAEKIVAGILFNSLRASAVKVYDVAEDSSVRLAYAFLPQDKAVEKLPREKVDSHFREWVRPRDYSQEAVWDILRPNDPVDHVCVTNPAADPCCRKIVAGGEKLFESNPFLLIGEKIAGRVTKLYKVDWPSSAGLLANYEFAMTALFGSLTTLKENLIMAEEDRALDEIERATAKVVNMDDLKAALSEISSKLAQIFERNGDGPAADRITIMIWDQLTDTLETEVGWTKENGIIEKSYLAGHDDKGIARKIFDGGTNLFLRKTGDWQGRDVEWEFGKKGALIGTIVAGADDKKLGLVVVNSDRDNAFTLDEERVLARVSKKLGPAFDRIVRYLEVASRDGKFGVAPYSLPVFNVSYLRRRVEHSIDQAERDGKPFSIIYLDIDRFKDTNESWDHGDVDYVLAQIFSRIVKGLTRGEGEVYRHGGEEIAIRLNASLAEAAIVAERIRAAIDQPFTVSIKYNSERDARFMLEKIVKQTATEHPESGFISGKVEVIDQTVRLIVTLRKSASLGVTQFQPGDNYDQMLRRADGLSKQAKANGRNGVAVDYPDRTDITNFDLTGKPQKKSTPI